MANYDVDIEIALRGADKLKQLTSDLKTVTREVGKVNAATIKLGKQLEEGFSHKKIENVNNYSNAVRRAERALRNAAMGTDAEKSAVRALVSAQKTYNKQLERQNALLKEEERIQGVLKVQASDRVSARSSLASPVFGARSIEGSPIAKAFGFEPKGGGKSAGGGTKVTGIDRVGAAISAGAFPLLFGGGPGMALGGAVGGGITGATFGPAAIALQVLGGAVDTYVAQLTSLANSLESTQGILSGLEEAGYRVSDATKSVISSYEDAGLFADAYAIALEEINRVLGPDGAAKLSAYNDETKKLQAEIEKVTASLQSELLPVFTGLIRVILGAKSAFDTFANSPLGKLFLQGAKQTAFNLVPGLKGAEIVLQALQAAGAPTGEPGIPESVRLAQEGADMASRTSQIEASQAAQEQIYLVDAQNKLVQAGNNLLDARVVSARKNVIQEEYLRKMRKEGITDDEKTLADREKQLALSRLGKEIETAQLREQERQTRELERQNKETERLTKKKERAIAKQIRAVERELESTDRAFDRASSQLDDIINKHEDKMAFEREYSRLIQEGSTPAAAKQAVELQKQLLKLDRIYDKQLEVVNAKILGVQESILELEIAGGITAEYEKQLDLLKKRKEELEGKKGKAKGAITKDLAPETGRDKIEAEMKRVQGVLNELIDPANQVILAANAIGDAFSESFKGLITGSMSAQEALANLFSRTADHFADMAAEMIAHAIKMKILGIALSFFNPTGGGETTITSNATSYSPPGFTAAGPIVPNAAGGYINSPTTALVGEGGESEYIIPESKMRESMSRYSRGARGSSVIPEAGGSGTSGEGGGAAVAAPIDVRYTVERINSVDYVTADQFQSGMRQAADQGARQGEQRALLTLRQNTSQRRRIGI